MIKKIFITGSAGFIGSHLSEKLFHVYRKCNFILYDKITYAAKKLYIKNLVAKKNVKFIKNDLLNFNVLKKNLQNVDLAINVAAESHVDNSFGNSLVFTKTNTLGTHCFLEACRRQKVNRIIHVSTDEVYGENSGIPFKEKQFLNPTNPYSAYKKSYNMNINTVRANNIYGTRQYPEKLISKTILCLLTKKKIPIHGKGDNYRHYLSVHDFCNGVVKIIKNGKFKEIYNISSDKSYKVKDIIKIIAKNLNKDFKSNIKFIKDRPFNDKIYKINCSKLKKLNWKVERNLTDDISTICDWYKSNINLFIK
jgi:dTDP-glucose 4,6-dehydratase